MRFEPELDNILSLVSDLSGDELPLAGDEADGPVLRLRRRHHAHDRPGQDRAQGGKQVGAISDIVFSSGSSKKMLL